MKKDKFTLGLLILLLTVIASSCSPNPTIKPNNSVTEPEAQILDEQHSNEAPNPLKEIEHGFYKFASNAMPDELPASFVHSEPLTFAAMIKSFAASNHGEKSFQVRIDALNTSNKEMDLNLKTEHIEIISAAVQDNFGNTYQCEIYNGDYYRKLPPGYFAKVGNLYCLPRLLPPDIEYLNVDLELMNWGKKSFKIPLTLDFEELIIKSSIQRYEEYNYFKITTEFYAIVPQYVIIKYSDISVVDDQGKVYFPSSCEGGYSSSQKEEYFGGLAERYSLGLGLICRFDDTIPYEVNSISSNYTLRGHDIRETIMTDTIR